MSEALVLHEDAGFGWIRETPLGRFKAVHAGLLPDNFVFECPGCGAWAYLDLDQWHGRVSVDHTDTGCTYHETHYYAQALVNATKESVGV